MGKRSNEMTKQLRTVLNLMIRELRALEADAKKREGRASVVWLSGACFGLRVGTKLVEQALQGEGKKKVLRRRKTMRCTNKACESYDESMAANCRSGICELAHTQDYLVSEEDWQDEQKIFEGIDVQKLKGMSY